LALDPASEEVIEFEVYQVCFLVSSWYCVSIGHTLQTTWNAPGFREYHRRMQIFILLYIEAGSLINEEEDTWEFVLL
jgi:histone acetyltransferase 1